VGTVVVTGPTDIGRTLVKYAVAWTADGSGEVSGNPFAVRAGYLSHIMIVPAYFVTPPTDAYDVYVYNEDMIDLLNGAGVNQSISTGEIVQFSPALYFPAGDLDVQVFNAGSGATGRVDIVML
jgi:hypothetical protein